MNLRSWLEQGPFSLAMSAGFFGFYSHTGFVKALWEEGFQPQKIMGSSAGALVGSLLSAGLTPFEIEGILKTTTKSHFWDLKFGFGLLEGKKFQGLLQKHLPTQFEHLKIPLSVSAFDLKTFKTKAYYTGDLIEPVRASCCFPLLFQPVKLEKSLLFDGGIGDWLGVAGPHYEERTLVHFLSPDGFGHSIIRKAAHRKIKPVDFMFQLKEPKRMGPNHMHLAMEAIHTAYVQTKEALNSRSAY